MIFKSHFFSMLVFAVIASTMLAFIRYDAKKEIVRYGLKLFLYMVVGVVAFSWFMHFL